jgi:hypothetical protein
LFTAVSSILRLNLAHIQDEDLAAAAHGGGLQDQPDGFGDGHEVTPHFLMRDGDRAATDRRNTVP